MIQCISYDGCYLGESVRNYWKWMMNGVTYLLIHRERRWKVVIPDVGDGQTHFKLVLESHHTGDAVNCHSHIPILRCLWWGWTEVLQSRTQVTRLDAMMFENGSGCFPFCINHSNQDSIRKVLLGKTDVWFSLHNLKIVSILCFDISYFIDYSSIFQSTFLPDIKCTH